MVSTLSIEEENYCRKDYIENLQDACIRSFDITGRSNLIDCRGSNDVIKLSREQAETILCGDRLVVDKKGSKTYSASKEFRDRANTNRRDKEMNDLHLAINNVISGDGREYPLLLLPVDLEYSKGKISVYSTGPPEMNMAPVLLRCLDDKETTNKKDFIQMPPLEGKDIDELTCNALNLLSTSGVDVSDSGLVENYEIGLFSLSKSFVSRDLLVMCKEGYSNNVTRIFFGSDKPGNEPLERDHIYTIYSVDDSQLDCLKAINTGETLVVIQGPPGTGKTYVIVVSAVNEVNSGGSTLFASEKKAAVTAAYEKSQGLCLNISMGIEDIRKDIQKQSEMRFSDINDGSIEEYERTRRKLEALCNARGIDPGLLRSSSSGEKIQPFDREFRSIVKEKSFREIVDAADNASRFYKLCELKFSLESKFPWITETSPDDEGQIMVAISERVVDGMRPRSFLKKGVTFEKAFSNKFLHGKTVTMEELMSAYNHIRKYNLSRNTYDDLPPLEQKIISEAVRLKIGSSEIKGAVVQFVLRAHVAEIDKSTGLSQTINEYRALTSYLFSLEKKCMQLSKDIARRKISAAAKKLLSIPDLKADLNSDIDKNKFLKKWGKTIARVHPYVMGVLDDVSRYIPLEEGLFTLGILDESSQIETNRACPFMYRVRRLAVIGDTKQMTILKVGESNISFSEDAFEEDISLRSKSLMDLGIALSNDVKTLRCNYRCQHKELTAFSNARFYDGKLNIIDVSELTGEDSDTPAIQVVHVPEGVWKNQTNEAQVQKVIQYIRHLCMMGVNDKSVRVITGSSVMRDRLIGELQKAIVKDETLAEWISRTQDSVENDMIKNLDNMQGLEGDIILLALGIAPGEDGVLRKTVFHQFNIKGGEGRLNVAITRAKSLLVWFTSFGPGEMDVSGTINIGPKLLRDFNDYCWAIDRRQKNVVESLIGSSSGNGTIVPEDELTPELAEYLRNRGYAVRENVSMGTDRIDIVAEKDGHRAAIFFDKTDYGTDSTSVGADTSRVSLLMSRGFDYVDRVFSLSIFYSSKEEVFEDLEISLSNAFTNGLSTTKEA